MTHFKRMCWLHQLDIGSDGPMSLGSDGFSGWDGQRATHLYPGLVSLHQAHTERGADG